MRKINKIILHCTATKEGQDFTVDDVRRWHIGRGFADIGYHYLIYLDGSVHKGRPIVRIGAHCSGQNKDSIGICYVGGLDSNNKPKDTRTDEQKAALVKLVKEEPELTEAAIQNAKTMAIFGLIFLTWMLLLGMVLIYLQDKAVFLRNGG